MKSKSLISAFLLIICIFCMLGAKAEPIGSNIKESEDIKQNKPIMLSNKLFSVPIPNNLKNAFSAKIYKDAILVYDKSSKKAGFGGFAFGIKAFLHPSSHANMPGGKKIGELLDKKNNLYDMVVFYPTDVQYDYVNKKSDTYDLLYNLPDTILLQIKAKNKNKYFYNQGTKGKDMYNEILKKHILATKEKWDSIKLEENDMSYMYNVINTVTKNPMDTLGYIYYDANGDGIEELLIGEIADGDWKGIIYDMYTMVDRSPKHVMSGGDRNRYYVCNGTFICNEYSQGADESGMRTYILLENSNELFPQVAFKYDGYENKKNPWFISYGEDKWENMDKKEFDERKKTFEDYKRFEYIPFSKFKMQN